MNGGYLFCYLRGAFWPMTDTISE